MSFQVRQLLKLLKLFLLEFSQPFSDAPEENPLGIIVQQLLAVAAEDFDAEEGDLDRNFDFNNLVVLTSVDNVAATPENTGDPGLYLGHFAHTTQTSTAQEVTGVYQASINVNTSPGNCVFIGNINRD